MRKLLSCFGSVGWLLLAACSSDQNGGTVPGQAGSAGAGQAGSVAQAGSAGSATAGSGGVSAGSGGMDSSGGSGGAGGAVAGSAGSSGAGGAGSGFMVPTVTWPSAACQAKTAGLLGMMTKAEKAGQLVMAGNANASPPAPADITSLAPGAVFSPGGASPPGGVTPQNWAAMTDGYVAAAAASRLKIPALYGVDAVHGMNAASGAVIFPHNAGLGSTQDPALVQEVARITALEASAMGVTWTFAPVVSVSFDDRWGRVYESFSEDPALTGLLSAAATMGLQGAMGLGSGKPGIVGCSKHWAGDGQAKAGTSAKGGVVDRGDIQIDEATMRKLGIAPYLQAIGAGLGSIMVSDATWNKASLTSNKHMIVDILKTELGFKGFVATDWNAADTSGGVVNVVNAGVDMLMQPSDWKGTIQLIQSGVDDARLNDAVTRILNVKCEAGLFEYQRDQAALASVGSAEHRAVARKAVAESLVVLKNDNQALPLAKASKVWVGGSGANSLANQCGGWTISWQGSGDKTTGTTISAAIGKVGTVAASMNDADVAVVVLSEKPYAEFLGDSQTLNTLPAADFQLLDQAHQAGKKVVAVVLSGRPVLIQDHLASADAWIAAWLPGTEGDGVADILYGSVKPTGKLSHSWPKTDAQANVNIGDAGYDPLFKLGFGLSY
jgi:beta-glucosidase